MGSKDKIIKRRVERSSAIFIDGVNLDRATKRLKRKVSIAKLIKSLSQGHKPDAIRYYTIIPAQDDSRHLAYLDAVQAAGAEVIVKRLPPIGKNIQIDVYPEMASDIIAFSLGHSNFSGLGTLRNLHQEAEQTLSKAAASKAENQKNTQTKKTITLVCPTRDISYSIAMATEFGVETVNADFSETVGRDVLKSSVNWIDLSDSEIIWKDED